MEISQNIDKAIHWITDSCIQDNDPNSPSFGSFRAWIDTKTNEYAYPYPETTGYALSTTSLLSKYDKQNRRILQSSNRAVDYLLRQCLSNGTGKFYIHNISNGNDGYTYTFDAGIILKGLIHGCLSGNINSHFYSTCLELADWLLCMQKPDGSFYAYYDTRQNQSKSSMKRWSTQSGSFHAKLSFALTQLYHETNNTKYLASLQKLVDWVIGLQKENGRFVTDTVQGSTFLHAHCYTIEGLLDAYNTIPNVKILHAAYKGIGWLTKTYQEEGSFPSVYYPDGHYLSEERSDIIAQSIRLLHITKRDLGHGEDLISELLNNLLSFQCFSEKQRLHGGFRFQRNLKGESESDGMHHINTWSSMVAVHAMIMCQQPSENVNMQYFI